MKRDIPTLRGTAVTLRALKPRDKDSRLRAGRHPEIVRMYGGDHRTVTPITSEQVEDWYSRVREAFLGWAIEVGGECIGSVRLDNYDEHNRSVRLSIGLFAPEHCGRGYGTETTKLVLDLVFSALDIHRIELRVLAYNQRAIGCYEKCGFKIEGILKDSALVAGRWEDDVIMSILEDEYK
jgi:ribosomal-protein-alanine N-acetyltransferase